MRLIDEQYLKTPCWGSRSMRNHLRRLGYKINRKRVQRLMRLMGLEAIYPKPKTSRPHPAHKVYPYLLRNTVVERPNQVWAADITYIPMSRGFITLWPLWTGTAAKFYPGGYPIPWIPIFASRPLKRPSAAMALRKYSILIKALNLPVPDLLNYSSLTMSVSAWTVVAERRIIFSLNGYGGHSSTSIFTFGPLTMAPSYGRASDNGLAFITPSVPTRHLTT